MTLRRRLTLVSAAGVATAIAIASVVVWFVVRGDLRGQVDDSLRDLAGGATVAPAPVAGKGNRLAVPILPGRRGHVLPRRKGPAVAPGRGIRARGHGSPPLLALPRQPPGAPGAYTQVVTSSGSALRPRGESPALPVTAEARQVASGDRGPFFSDADVGGSHLRVLTQMIGPGAAVQVARSLDDVDSTMRS